MNNEFRIRRGRLISTEIRVPGDKSISQRIVVLAALANGPSVISGFLPCVECMAAVDACRALGARIDFLAGPDHEQLWTPDEAEPQRRPTRLRVHGVSMKPQQPGGPIQLGTSSTTLALLAGILAGQPFASQLLADETTARPVVERIAGPLEAMGAEIAPEWQWAHAAIHINGRFPLKPLHYVPQSAHSQTAAALLTAGLFAAGRTTVELPAVTRDHTERLLKHFQVKSLRRGLGVCVYGGQIPESRDFHVPGDISFAANWIVAAALQPGSELVVRGVGLNDTRTGFLRVLVRMGAQVMEFIDDCNGEPRGTVIVRGAPLRGTLITAEELPELHDELPLLAIAASMASGTTGIDEPPDGDPRLQRIVHNLRLMGVSVSTGSRGIEINGNGGELLQPGCIPSGHDRRMAMAFCIAGLFTEGETIVENIECVREAYPEFDDYLHLFQSREVSDGLSHLVISPVPQRTAAAGRKSSRKPDDKAAAGSKE